VYAVEAVDGAVYSKQGRYDEAFRSLQTALECDGRSSQPHSSLAAIYNMLGDLHHADKQYKIAVQLAPHTPNVLLNYAMFLHRHGQAGCLFTVLLIAASTNNADLGLLLVSIINILCLLTLHV